ncbi:hypothetical protein [Novosphingobium sp. FSW06-99]|uniref:hypothetical protein n=1 Tax=Novosphingobium sp. FSW06-99 TaxID=1739113 RepID=UPI00076C8D8D|nr:hypothetical protein [Novosphingobium sp. FSW06-99]KUR80499.1 hypothetical protein AQZ49_00030 [Novosphingobium sp. FSW06-99]
MRLTLVLGLSALLAATAAAPAYAQDGAPACTAPVAPEGILAPWSTPGQIVAATNGAQVNAATLAIGQAARISLAPTPDVHYVIQPEKPGGSVSHGGLVAFTAPADGAYRIALGSPAWIDVIGDGRPALSTAHGHGPACSGIRKMVDFSLTKGSYVLQISANGDPQTAVLIVRLP